MKRTYKWIKTKCLFFSRKAAFVLSTSIVLSASFGLYSCEALIDWEIEAEQNNAPVIEAILTNEVKQHQIKITKPIYELNAIPEPLSEANVWVYDGYSSYPFTENPMGSGLYYSQSQAAGINRTYTLFIEIKGITYQATAKMEPVTRFLPLEYIESDNVEGMYEIDWKERIFNSDHPCMWEILIDWSHLPAYNTVADDSCKARLLAYTLPSLDVSQIFKPEKAEVYFPRGTKIIHRKYSLTDEYAEFLRTLLSETEWRGGFFDVVPSNVVTNFNNGALGFFAVCAVQSHTIWVIRENDD